LFFIQAPQQNNDRLQDNNDTSNKDNKPKTTSQRGPPTDKESLQSKDISIKSDEETTEESPKIPASSQQKMTTEQESSSSPLGLLFLYRFLIGRVLLLVAGFFHYFHWLAVETLCLLTRFLYLMSTLVNNHNNHQQPLFSKQRQNQ
jgi:hypothetical protein